MPCLRHPAFAAVAAAFVAACETVSVAPCDATGAGTLVVSITGLPTTIDAAVTVTGPGGTFNLTASQTLNALPGGAYTVTSAPVEVRDATVSSYLRGSVPSAAICVRDAETRTLSIPHTVVGPSGKVWVGSGFYSLGFTPAQLVATATIAPAVVLGTRGGAAGAFDRDGNLWLRGQTSAEPYLMRFSAASLSASGTPNPDRAISIAGVNCEGAAALAFDDGGNLWISIACQQRIVRLSAAQLNSPGLVQPGVQITNLVAPEGLAFDAAGNLWVADHTQLRRYDAARLGSNITTAADLRVAFTTPSPPTPGASALLVKHLAFSPSGELWVSSYVQNVLYRVEPAIAAATGNQNVQVTRILYISEFASPRGFAFDNGGDLHIGYEQNTIARFGARQLSSNVTLPSRATPQSITASASILAFAENVLLFPAPATTPLYSRAR